MGMSWIICVKNQSFSTSGGEDILAFAKKDCNLIDNIVFEDENLGLWMELTAADYSAMYAQKYLPITCKQVRLALGVLTSLVESVKTMYADGTYVVGDTTYTQNEITELVTATIRRDYHFGFPWDGSSSIGVPRMINALTDVLEYMEEHPTDIVVLFVGEAMEDGKHDWVYTKSDHWVQDSTMRA